MGFLAQWGTTGSCTCVSNWNRDLKLMLQLFIILPLSIISTLIYLKSNIIKLTLDLYSYRWNNR